VANGVVGRRVQPAKGATRRAKSENKKIGRVIRAGMADKSLSNMGACDGNENSVENQVVKSLIHELSGVGFVEKHWQGTSFRLIISKPTTVKDALGGGSELLYF
jgi:hypothetical protein